jgi:SAM-dependent methyltransferase
MTRQVLGKKSENYVFNNAAPETNVRFAMLEQIFDEGTSRHFRALGLTRGWQCLEVGAGGPALPLWLSERVGETGAVVATDIDTRHLDKLRRANLTVIRHDITRDALQQGVFDLVHARLVLAHLPSRRDGIARRSNTRPAARTERSGSCPRSNTSCASRDECPAHVSRPSQPARNSLSCSLPQGLR